MMANNYKRILQTVDHEYAERTSQECTRRGLHPMMYRAGFDEGQYIVSVPQHETVLADAIATKMLTPLLRTEAEMTARAKRFAQDNRATLNALED